MGMTDKKILELLDGYEKKLNSLDTSIYEPVDVKKLVHASEMIPKMKTFLAEGRREKVFRWLGFLQCVFWMLEAYSIDELAAHSRPTKSDLKEQYPEHSFDAFGCAKCSRETGMGCVQRACDYAKEYLEAPLDGLAIK